ncbi:probable phosphatidylglycerophosphatase, mitochondrial isoform X1 [Selaginella moellendorffii]|uniref:probable phosphatidylglycerophosphatase, mitochondrial isoform X1 n=1 Tax=Selaginella moellendorffii TaxID=88036 RepID=UPI000D1CB49C|nr:probable phosphatidylglycerophosphatase, mitochondrial isoform X1 [Selaginella moellendorffii]|eukprot:XP_024530659.1 probable phosphatidylglycerophosphatase, mitochondrial isoform X1 [Selaginella moellendorffii]
MSLGGAGAPAVISRSVCCCNADLSAPRHSMIAKLGQRFNAAGIGSAARVLLRDRSLMLPHVHVPDISWIDWRALKERGFAGVVFDKDNTLTAPYVATVWPTLGESLEECRKCFGENVALLSNSAGLYQFDPAGVEADALEKSLGISVIRHGSKKPAGNADALKKRFGCDASLLVMVGDRHLTDVVYGNKNGLLTISTEPLTLKGEPFIVTRVRRFEDAMLRRWKSSGLKPPPHSLHTTEFDFIKDPGCW